MCVCVREDGREREREKPFYHSCFSSRLQTQLAEKESDHSEAVSSLQSKHSAEIQNLKKLLASSEATNTDLQKEVSDIKKLSICIQCIEQQPYYVHCTCTCIHVYPFSCRTMIYN